MKIALVAEDATALSRATSSEPATQETRVAALASELARLLTRDEFPLTRSELLAILDQKDASPPLVARVSTLPERRRYHSTHEVLEALGLADVEEGPDHGR